MNLNNAYICIIITSRLGLPVFLGLASNGGVSRWCRSEEPIVREAPSNYISVRLGESVCSLVLVRRLMMMMMMMMMMVLSMMSIIVICRFFMVIVDVDG